MSGKKQAVMLRWAMMPECLDLPKGWKVRRFTEIATVIAGQSPPSSTYNERGEGLPFLQGNADFGDEYPAPTSWCNAPQKIALLGDTLISVRAPVGELNRADRKYAIGRGLAAVRATDSNQAFLHQALIRWRQSLQRVAQGTTFDAVTARHFAQLYVACPPPAEQVAIAQVLDAVDTAIERTRTAIEQAEALDHSILHELLGQNAKTRKNRNWPLTRVDAVAAVDSGLTLGKDVTGFKSVTRPYLRVANVQDGHLNLDTIKFVTVRQSEVEKFELQAGDVLMTEGGDFDKLGRGALWDGQIPGCLHQNHVFRVRADQAKLDPRYFACVVESDIAKAYFNRVAKRTTNLASTNKTQVRAFRFPLPTLHEQQRIADTVAATKAKVRTLCDKHKALQTLKTALLQDLLTGKVRVGALAAQTLASTNS